MVHKDYCSKCKTTKVPLIKHSRTGNTQYYYCRLCNAAIHRRLWSTDAGKLSINRANRKYAAKSPEKISARRKVNHAIRSGRLVRPESCENCGVIDNLQAHHQDHLKPLDIVWLCTSCHAVMD